MATGLVGAAAGGDRPPRRIVGTSSRAGERAARRRAHSVTRMLAFGTIGSAVAGRFSDRAVRELRQRSDVRYVEDDGAMHAIGRTLPWGVDRVDAETLHANGETGGDDTDGEGGAHIAIIDTGIDSDHPDLAANLGTGRAFVECRGNPRLCREQWDDDNNHGTHCAGIADADDTADGVVGVSTAARLHAVKVLDKNGSGSFSDVAAGIKWTADQGYDVGSMSLGASSGSQTVRDACSYAYHGDGSGNGGGVLLVAAAGNSGPCTDCVGYPAAYDTVMAISSTTSDDSLSGFSSTGPAVELAAPGSSIYSTVVGGYDTYSGTSMACPHVSGAGGQLMDNGYTNSAARDQLTATAEDIGLTTDEQGSGLLDSAAALGFDSSDNLSDGTNDAPSVDSLSAAEVETSDSDAAFDVTWEVGDSDGNLSSVDLTLSDETDTGTEDSASISVSGSGASGTTRLVASGDDGSGHSYTVAITVTDGDGVTATDSTSVSETEDSSGGGENAPTVDNLSLSEDNSGGSPHADFDASWSVSDSDGDLESVQLTLTDTDTGATEETAAVAVSGSDASGTTGLKAKFDENNGHTYEVEIVVTDATGNSASATATEIEDGS